MSEFTKFTARIGIFALLMAYTAGFFIPWLRAVQVRAFCVLDSAQSFDQIMRIDYTPSTILLCKIWLVCVWMFFVTAALCLQSIVFPIDWGFKSHFKQYFKR